MNVKELEKEVYARRPVLKEIAEQFSHALLADYILNHWEVFQAKPDAHFLQAFEHVAESIFGKALAERASTQLLTNPLVSTIEHHGIWNAPIFVNSSLLYSLRFAPSELVIALATESVSLNNTSSFSGSLLVHKQEHLQRYSFFSDKLKTLPVFSAPAITQNDLDRVAFRLPTELKEFVGTLGLQEVLRHKNFSAQASVLTNKIWNVVFPEAPQLLYVPLESVILKYLEIVLADSESLFSKLILTKQGNLLWNKYFASEHTGMFWEINNKGRRKVQKTVVQDENVEDVLELIRLRKIYPSSPFCFLVLLHAGLTCVGGFTQTTWLTGVKEKFVHLLKEMSVDSSLVQKVPTKNFAESALAFLKNGSTHFSPTAVDLYLSGKHYYPVYKKVARRLTLGESLKLAMPSIYKVVVPTAEQKFRVDDMYGSDNIWDLFI